MTRVANQILEIAREKRQKKEKMEKKRKIKAIVAKCQGAREEICLSTEKRGIIRITLEMKRI